MAINFNECLFWTDCECRRLLCSIFVDGTVFRATYGPLNSGFSILEIHYFLLRRLINSWCPLVWKVWHFNCSVQLLFYNFSSFVSFSTNGLAQATSPHVHYAGTSSDWLLLWGCCHAVVCFYCTNMIFLPDGNLYNILWRVH